MKFYRHLNLPSIPIKRQKMLDLVHLKQTDTEPLTYQTNHFNVREMLTEDILEIFQRLDCEPMVLAHFASPKLSKSGSRLHIDMIGQDFKWVPLPASINWDLTPGELAFSWYDTSELKEFLPVGEPLRGSSEQPLTSKDFNGIRYGRNGIDEKTDITPLETLIFERNTPYLVRTDIPHQTQYNSLAPIRISASLRFPLEKVPTWDRALDVFSSIIK